MVFPNLFQDFLLHFFSRIFIFTFILFLLLFYFLCFYLFIFIPFIPTNCESYSSDHRVRLERVCW